MKEFYITIKTKPFQDRFQARVSSNIPMLDIPKFKLVPKACQITPLITSTDVWLRKGVWFDLTETSLKYLYFHLGEYFRVDETALAESFRLKSSALKFVKDFSEKEVSDRKGFDYSVKLWFKVNFTILAPNTYRVVYDTNIKYLSKILIGNTSFQIARSMNCAHIFSDKDVWLTEQSEFEVNEDGFRRLHRFLKTVFEQPVNSLWYLKKKYYDRVEL